MHLPGIPRHSFVACLLKVLHSMQLALPAAANLLYLGNRFAPKMNEGHNAYRWFSSLLLHRDFVQLGSNLLLFLALGLHLECRFGTRRLLLLTMVAGVGGNFFSAAFEVSK